MALLPHPHYQTLSGWSFIQEFTRHEKEYLDLAHRVAQTVSNTFNQLNVPISSFPLEDFAERHLVDDLTASLLAPSFFYFRQALRRGIRQYINPVDHGAFAEMMARYVLQEAINRRVLL